MSEVHVQVVRGMYDCFARGDVPGVLAAMDTEIEWNEAEGFPYADGNPYIGPNAVVEGVFSRLVSEWEYWNLDVQEILDAGDTVIALGRYKAKNKETAVEINAQFAHFWSMKNGKAAGFQQYADTAQVSRAVGR